MKRPALILALLAATGTAAHAQDDPAPPTEAQALFAWLQSGQYKGWRGETQPHSARSPHPTYVQVYMNRALYGSMMQRQAEHPAGAASVKEMYDMDGKLRGWAAAIKTQDRSAVGQGWYWYEVLSTTDPDRLEAAGTGVRLCAGCHVGGHDFVMTRTPLR